MHPWSIRQQASSRSKWLWPSLLKSKLVCLLLRAKHPFGQTASCTGTMKAWPGAMTGSKKKTLLCGSRTRTTRSFGRYSEAGGSTIWSHRPEKHNRQNRGNAREAMIMKGRVKRWKSKSATKRMGYGTSCTGTIVSRASWSRPKNSVLSAYGGSGICDISGKTARRCTQSCRSQAS